MQITNNAKAFLASAVLVTVFSLALALSGVIGGDDGPGTIVGGESVTPVASPSPGVRNANPAFLVPPAAAPTFASQAPSASTPIISPIDLPILMYHRVQPFQPDDESGIILTVTNADFDAQMEYLDCAGYSPITLAQLFAAFDGRSALPQRPVVLTFDDGWEEHYSQVVPVLRKHGFIGSFGIVTAQVGSDGPYVTWPQVEDMAAAGMEITAHSVSHIDLGTAEDAVVLNEVEASKAELEEHIGRNVEFFVYPAGEPFRSGTEERQAQIVLMLKDTGYRGALLATNTMTIDPSAPYAVNRLRASGEYDIYSFAGLVSGPSPDQIGCP